MSLETKVRQFECPVLTADERKDLKDYHISTVGGLKVAVLLTLYAPGSHPELTVHNIACPKYLAESKKCDLTKGICIYRQLETQ